jgi:hypothetical protein
MKNFGTLVVGLGLIGCLLIAGCGNDNGDEGYNMAEFWPLGQGDTRTYGWESSFAKIYDGMYTQTVSGPEAIDGVEAFRLQTDYGSYMLFTNTNGLTRYKDGVEAEYHRIFTPPLQEYPATMSFGEQHTFFSDVTYITAEGNSYADSVSTTTTLVGAEAVTVPAGTFSECLKFMQTWTYVYIEGDSENCEITEWIAKHVGTVKFTEQCQYIDADGGDVGSYFYGGELVNATVSGVNYSDSSAKEMEAAQKPASSVPPGFARSRRR